MNSSDLINADQTWFDIPPVQPMQSRNQARKLQNASGNMAFFKTPQNHVLGNEVLGWVLADRLSLPCAQAQFASLPDATGQIKDGILSFRVTGVELIEWPIVPDEIRQNLAKYVLNHDDIAKIAIFDVWTYNNDRSTANLIISRKLEWKKKYLIYMIDHEECFYGYAETCNRHDQDGMWMNPDSFIHIPEVKSIINYSQVDSFIADIENITDDELKQLIGMIPSRYYNPNQADTVFNILQKRRNILRTLIQDWCKKENKL